MTITDMEAGPVKVVALAMVVATAMVKINALMIAQNTAV
jgi:hypothetical protein